MSNCLNTCMWLHAWKWACMFIETDWVNRKKTQTSFTNNRTKKPDFVQVCQVI